MTSTDPSTSDVISIDVNDEPPMKRPRLTSPRQGTPQKKGLPNVVAINNDSNVGEIPNRAPLFADNAGILGALRRFVSARNGGKIPSNFALKIKQSQLSGVVPSTSNPVPIVSPKPPTVTLSKSPQIPTTTNNVATLSTTEPTNAMSNGNNIQKQSAVRQVVSNVQPTRFVPAILARSQSLPSNTDQVIQPQKSVKRRTIYIQNFSKTKPNVSPKIPGPKSSSNTQVTKFFVTPRVETVKPILAHKHPIMIQQLKDRKFVGSSSIKGSTGNSVSSIQVSGSVEGTPVKTGVSSCGKTTVSMGQVDKKKIPTPNTPVIPPTPKPPIVKSSSLLPQTSKNNDPQQMNLPNGQDKQAIKAVSSSNENGQIDLSSLLEDQSIVRAIRQLVNETHGSLPPKVVVKIKTRTDSASSPASVPINSLKQTVILKNIDRTQPPPLIFSARDNIAQPSTTIVEVRDFPSDDCYPDGTDHFSNSTCMVERLVDKPFTSSEYTPEDRQKIITKGRLRPFMKNFTLACYKRCTWLTACTKVNKFFCWPCLLFSKKSIWSLLNDGGIQPVDMERLAAEHGREDHHQKMATTLATWEMLYTPKDKTVSHNSVPPSIPPPVEKELTGPQINDNEESCLIKLLLEDRFMSENWTDEDRFNFIQSKPSSNFDMYRRSFPKRLLDEEVEKKVWLVGSLTLKSWFCWPCLLFTDKEIWADTGLRLDVSTAVIAHEITQYHMSACFQLKLWENKVREKLMPEKISGEPQVDDIKRDWVFFKHLINVICVEKMKRNNTVMYAETLVSSLELLSRYDHRLKKCFNKRTSDFGQGGLEKLVSDHTLGILASIEFIIRAKLRAEIRVAPFVSLILSDTSDFVNKSWISVVLRFADDRGNLKERFVKFIKVGEDRRSPKEIFNRLKPILDELECQKKLIGFTYDGAVVPPSEILDFNRSIRSEYKASNFFCYRGHKWKLILQQALSHLPCCRTFFQRIADLSNFIRTSSSMKNLCNLRGQPVTFTAWDVSNGFLSQLLGQYAPIVRRLEVLTRAGDFGYMKDNSSGIVLDNLDNEGMAMALSLLEFFKTVYCRFMLLLLDTLFSQFNELSTIFDRRFDWEGWHMFSRQTYQNLLQLKVRDFGRLYDSASVMSGKGRPSPYTETQAEDQEPLCRKSFHPIVDTALLLLVNRADNFETWSYLDAAAKKARLYPEAKLLSLCSILTKQCEQFSPQTLMTQLRFLYDNQFFFGITPPEMVKSIRNLELFEIAEVHAFLRLVITLPIISIDDDPRLPAIERMAKYLEGKTDVNSLNSTDALMWMEKDLLESLLKSPLFHSNVLNHHVKSLS